MVLPFHNLFSQSFNYDSELKNKRKVMVDDSLDQLLNSLIEYNECIESRGYSFVKKNTDWREGKIFTKENDTLIGEIKNAIHQGGETSMILFYRKNIDSVEVRYRADKLNGYQCSNKEFCTKRFSNLPPGFIERLENGNIELFYVKYPQNRGFINNQLNIVDDEDYYLEISGCNQKELILIPLEVDTFPEFIKNYIKDYFELSQKIEQLKYTGVHIREIIQIYNLYFNTKKIVNQ